MNAESGRKPETFFGIALGLAAAMLCLSILYTLSRTALVWMTIFTLGGLLIVPLALATMIGIGLAGRGHFRGVKWIHVALMVVPGWPMATLTVPAIRILHARYLANSLPIYPNAEIARSTFDPFDSDDGPASVSLRLHTSASENDVIGFYRAQLTTRGWKETPLPGRWQNNRPNLYFSKRLLTIEVYLENDPIGRSPSVDVICKFERAARD